MTLAATAVFFLVLALGLGPAWVRAGEEPVSRRIAPWVAPPASDDDGPGAGNRHGRDARRRTLFLHRLAAFLPEDRYARRERDLKNIGVELSPAEFAALETTAMLAITVLALACHRPAGLALAAAVPPAANAVIAARLRQRAAAINAQLADALAAMASAVRAGFGLPQAIAMAAGDAREPIRSVLARFVTDTAKGVPVDDALRNMAADGGGRDFEMAATAIAVARQAGGSIAETLDRIQTTIKDRIAIHNAMRTMTAQARMSGAVVALLPAGIVLLVGLIDPKYLAPLFHTGAGRIMLAAAAGCVAAGGLVIRKLVNSAEYR